MERTEATAGQEDEESHDASVRLSHVILISVGRSRISAAPTTC